MNLKKTFYKRSVGYILLVSFIAIFLLVLGYFLIPFNFSNFGLSQEVVIKYADNISPAHQIVIDNFNEEYKGQIRVEAINLPFIKFSTNERKELLTRSLRSKSDKLDVFAIDLIWSSRFAKWAEPLGRYITKNDTIDLIPEALEPCIVDTKLVALPMYLDIGVLYYRRDLIQSLPNASIIEKKLQKSISWEDFIALSRSFDSNKNPFYIFPADNYEGFVCSIYEILYNQKENFFLQDSMDWNSEEIRNSFLLLSNIINKHKITPPIVTDYRENNCYDYFLFNQGVFLRGWASFTKDSKTYRESVELPKLIEQAPLPHLKGSKPVSTIGGWNIMLSKYSENKEEALEFIKYLLREKSQKIFYEQGAFLPVISSVYSDSSFITKYPTLSKNKKLLDSGIHRPFLANYTKISDVISFYANKVIKKKISVDSAMDKINQALMSGELILR